MRAAGFKSKVKFTAAHKEIALEVRTDVFALLIDQFGAAEGAEVPPVLFRFRFFLGPL